jgi:hypothetical protein
MPAAEVPHLVKHTTIAIWKHGGVAGGPRERFVSAWNIARARLTEYGYLTKGSEGGKAADIKLTGKGVQRNHKHAREADGKAKSAMFDEMFRWIEVAEGAAKAQGKPLQPERKPNSKDRGDLAKTRQDTQIVSPRLNTPKKIERKPALQSRKLGDKPKPTQYDRKRPK